MVLDTTDNDVVSVPAGRHEPSAVVLVSIQLELIPRKEKLSLNTPNIAIISSHLLITFYLNRVVGDNIVVTKSRVPWDVEGLRSVHIDETFLEVLVVF